ncbi:hypothetical protein ACFPM3_32635 [Streptomyces coeruleoprunus]|uniref:DUF4190 domain-containing protein n=1 Tax=Streptomyces coeruleoprunus TaxID=285563 RepID=A0ABV9XNA9_9ACTN
MHDASIPKRAGATPMVVGLVACAFLASLWWFPPLLLLALPTGLWAVIHGLVLLRRARRGEAVRAAGATAGIVLGSLAMAATVILFGGAMWALHSAYSSDEPEPAYTPERSFRILDAQGHAWKPATAPGTVTYTDGVTLRLAGPEPFTPGPKDPSTLLKGQRAYRVTLTVTNGTAAPLDLHRMGFTIGDAEQLVLGEFVEARTKAAQASDGRVGPCPDKVPAGRSVTCVRAVATFAGSDWLAVSVEPTERYEDANWRLPLRRGAA